MIEENFNPEKIVNEKERIENETNKFNWGAACFAWIWGAFNGAFLKTFIPSIIITTIYFIPIIGSMAGFACIGLIIYFGLNGNQWAWDNKKWRNLDHYITVQRRWGIAALIVLIVSLILTVLVIFFGMFALKNTIETSGDNITTESYVKIIKNNKSLTNTTNGEILANEIIKIKNASNNSERIYELYNKNTIAIKDYNDITKQTELMELYSFTKNGNPCSISKKNCYIINYQVENNKILPISKTYFDNNGKTKEIKLYQNK